MDNQGFIGRPYNEDAHKERLAAKARRHKGLTDEEAFMVGLMDLPNTRGPVRPTRPHADHAEVISREASTGSHVGD